MGFFNGTTDDAKKADSEVVLHRKCQEFYEENKNKTPTYNSRKVRIVEIIDPMFGQGSGSVFRTWVAEPTKVKITLVGKQDPWGDPYYKIIDPDQLPALKRFLDQKTKEGESHAG